LELRAPFLDPDVVQLGLSLPTAAKIKGRRGKAILREAFADSLPREVLRAPKRGFGLPLSRWLREDLQAALRDTLLCADLRRMRIFREEALAGLINDHVLRRADHSHRLWALLVLGRWLLSRS
jgi:asparagine synthase (glutamine-hydrolysing)